LSDKELSATIARCRRERRLADSIVSAVELPAAYRVQAALAEGRPLSGYKLGLLSPAKQAQMGISAPIYGRILDGMLMEGPVSLATFLQPRVEPEIAVVLRGPIAAGATPGAIHAAIGGYYLAVDILDSVWRGYKFTIAEVVSDNASGGGFLLGPQRFDAAPHGALRLWLNGRIAGGGPVDSLGDPGERLAWLASQTGSLPAGAAVFLGSPAAAVPAEPGTLEVSIGRESFVTRLVP